MSSIQFDYSTLSTEIEPGVVSDLIENSYDSSEESNVSTESSVVETRSSENAPPDKFRLVYITFGLIGMATLLPWNFFITAYDYWMYKFADTENTTNVFSSSSKKSDLQALFASYLSLANNVPFVLFLIVSPLFNDRVSHLYRIAGSLFTTILLFLIFTALVEVNTDSWQMSFFALTMVLVVLVSVASAVFQSGAAGVVAMLPSNYIHAMVLGQALAGVFASFAEIMALLGHHDSLRSALAYFMCADITLVITLLAYLSTQSSAFFQFFLRRKKDVQSLRIVSETEVRKTVSVPVVIKLVWPYAASVMLVFWVTLAIFPGIAVLVVSESSHWNTLATGKLFLPVSCFLLFNISDLCGRAVGGWISFPYTWKFCLLCVCVMRFAFIPLFMLCNAHPRSHLPVVFLSDAHYIAFIVLLGFTNGYLFTVAMINGSKSLTSNLQEMSGVILAAFLGAGLMLGSVSSYALVQLL